MAHERGMTTLLTPTDVDRLLALRPGESARLAKRGKLPALVLPNGEYRFRPQDIEAILDGATPDDKGGQHE